MKHQHTESSLQQLFQEVLEQEQADILAKLLEQRQTQTQTSTEQHSAHLYEQFDQCQLETLTQHIRSLDQYCLMLSSEIKHQEASINTLPTPLLQKFNELSNRKTEMITKGKHNLAFLQLLLQPYRQLTSSQNSQKKALGTFKQDNNHSHSCHLSQAAITNMFYHMVSEWSPTSNIQQIKKVLQNCELNWSQIATSSQSSQKGQRQKILVVGCGMGRILQEIKNNFKSKSNNVLLQGHQTDAELYLCADYFLNRCNKQTIICPYIHNFSNYLKTTSPYREVTVPCQLDDRSYFYPLTWGPFFELYKSHKNEWNCIITFFNNYHVEDILNYIKLIYRMLREGGIWLDVSTPNFSKNVIPMSYKQYENILDKSQFKLLQKFNSFDYWYHDEQCIMNEKRKTYYRIMQK